MKRYAKLIPPLIGTIAMAVLLAYRGAAEDNVVTATEWVLLITQGASAIAVWGAVNVPGWSKGKTFQAVLFTVLGLLATLIVGGLNGDEIQQLIILALSAAGVAGVPQPLSAVGTEPPARHAATGQDSPPGPEAGW